MTDTGITSDWVERGLAFWNEKRFEDALRLYEQVITQEPANALAWRNKAAVQLDLEHPYDALVSVNQSLELNPRDADAWNAKGVALTLLDRESEAQACLDQALAVDPTCMYALINRGFHEIEHGRLEEGLAFITEVVQLNDQHILNLACMVGLLIDLERHQEALATVDLAFKHGAEGCWWRIMQGDVYYNLEQYAEAESAYDRALKIEPENPEALADKGWVARQQGRDEDALRYFEQVLVITPSNVQATQQRAAALYRLRRYCEALPAYKRVFELTPSVSDVWSFKGVSLHELGRLNEAIPAFKQAVQLNPGDADTWHWLGFTLKNLNQLDEAAEAYHRALALTPDNGQVYSEQAEVLLDLGRFQDALESAERAIPLTDGSVRSLHAKGRALYNMQRYEESLDWYRQAIANAPGNDNILRNQALTESALGHIDEALVSIERAIALQPKRADSWIRRAGYLRELGRTDEAIAAAAKATAVGPNNGIIWRERAELLWKFGRYEEANTAIDIAARLRPEDPHIVRWQVFIHEQTTQPFEDKTIKLSDGRTLGYCDYGDPNGTPLVCCHGMPGSRLDYIMQIAELKARHLRLIVPDRPGYGLSTFQKYELVDWPNDLMGLMDTLHIEKFAIFGISGGGAFAAASAYRFPERITRLGLVSSGAPNSDLEVEYRGIKIGRIRRRLVKVTPWPVHRLSGSIGGRVSYANPTLAIDLWRNFPDWEGGIPSTPPTPRTLEAIRSQYAQYAIGNAWESRILMKPWSFKLEDIVVPTWLWHGEKDTLAPVSGAHYLAATIPGCHATFYPTDTHFLFDKHRSEIMSVLSDSDSE